LKSYRCRIAFAAPGLEPLVELVVTGAPALDGGELRIARPLRTSERVREPAPLLVGGHGDRQPLLLLPAAVEPLRRDVGAAVAVALQEVAVRGLLEHELGGSVERAFDHGHLEQAPLAIGIGADARMFQRGKALDLDGAGRGDPRANLGAALRGGRRTRSAALTAGTSICRSMRSSSGPEMRA